MLTHADAQNLARLYAITRDSRVRDDCNRQLNAYLQALPVAMKTPTINDLLVCACAVLEGK